LAEFEARGVVFVSLRDNLDLSTPAGRLQFHIIGAMAEFERELIRERVCCGLARRRARGLRLGRAPAHVAIPRLQQLRGEGLSWSRCAQLMKIPRSCLQRAYAAAAKNA
jgi:DNA invertase Pin-like site-specific DNA recombinase